MAGDSHTWASENGEYIYKLHANFDTTGTTIPYFYGENDLKQVLDPEFYSDEGSFNCKSRQWTVVRSSLEVAAKSIVNEVHRNSTIDDSKLSVPDFLIISFAEDVPEVSFSLVSIENESFQMKANAQVDIKAVLEEAKEGLKVSIYG